TPGPCIWPTGPPGSTRPASSTSATTPTSAIQRCARSKLPLRTDPLPRREREHAPEDHAHQSGENLTVTSSTATGVTRRHLLRFGLGAAALVAAKPVLAVTAIAPEPRKLRFYNTHTNEKLTVVYWKDGE